MKILFLGTPNSIHDFKWISFFSNNSDYKTFLTCDKEIYKKLTTKDFDLYREANISLINPYDEFSFSNPFVTIRQIFRFRKLIKSLEIDAVHSLFGTPFPIWFNFMAGVKKIVTTRGSDVLVMLPEIRNAKVFKVHHKLLYYGILRSYKKCDFITCTSKKQINALKGFGIDAGKIKYIKTGVNVNEIENIEVDAYIPSDLKGLNIVFSPRFMRPVYNFEYQIAAYTQLPDDIKANYTFVFIRGVIVSDDYFNKLINQLDAIKGFKYKVFYNLTQKEIWAITKHAELSLMVPKSDGTPNTALEAMSCRTPLIMGDLDYDKTLFGGAALFVDLNNPQDLTEKIIMALNDFPNSILEKAYFNVKKFGNRTVEMEKLKELYNLL